MIFVILFFYIRGSVLIFIIIFFFYRTLSFIIRLFYIRFRNSIFLSIRILINQCNKIYNTNKKLIKTDKIEKNSIDSIDLDSKIDLYNAISTLPNELRIPTILFYFDDLSYKDISDILSIPEGTVKSRVFRAKEKLYKILKEV